ncbi:MAG: ribulose-phosphate 3-epimerase-like [Parcubacteria group bacterium Gr01-1014_38]|nr:MAG: ribulose-phosphate 3-epimerase-like [Parcubacteria group bacterium Gr01-1014_38]
MASLLPAINAYTEEEFVERAQLLRALNVRCIQLDISDGIFGIPENFSNPEIAARELPGMKLDIHLMARDVLAAIAVWHKILPVRITVHIEVLRDPRAVLEQIRTAGSERGLALGPQTPVETVQPHLREIDFLLFVAVPPGRSGQRLDPETPSRIQTVRQQYPHLPIGVDGGVTATVVPQLLAAGATTITVASALFSAPDPKAAYAELKRLVEA